MRKRPMKRRASFLLRALLLFPLLSVHPPAPASAQQPTDVPNEPPYFAIRNARIVPVAGPVIERGTVVVSDGLITAVGADVTVPPEAWVIDGEGLTVYPGLVDALSDLGLQGAEGGGRGGGPPGGGGGGQNPFASPQGPVAHGPEDRPATTPWKSAADELTSKDKRIESWRKGGFTTALSVPSEGIFAGQGAVIDLSGDGEGMVVETPAAFRVNLTPVGGFRSFPGSLMGVIAYVRQVFLDADHYTRAMAAYEAAPVGRERPKYDRTLAPVHRAVAEGWPVLLPGNRAREIRRAVRLGRELGVRTVVAGVQQGWELAGELASAGVPVLVNLKWPTRTRDADPEADESLESLRMRAYAPSTPAALEKAGVTFAFYDGGLASPKEALKNVRKAIDEGLSKPGALRALTLAPARIFGVDDRLGSIEAGKIANLTVTDGDLFDAKTKVKMVFVDGKKFEIRQPTRPTEAPAADLSGTWTLTVQSPRGAQESTAELEMAEDGTLSGTVSGQRGEGTITEGWVSGSKFSFTVSSSFGGRTVEITYTGRIEEGEMKGTVSFGGRFSTDFTGTRPGGNGGAR